MLDDDWKTCIDINECSEDMIAMKPELKCNYGCINTIGSFKCITDAGAADQPLLDDDITNLDDIIDTDPVLDENTNNYIAAVNDVKYNADVDADEDDVDVDIDNNDDNGNKRYEDTQICVNGYFYNETISDCQGELK